MNQQQILQAILNNSGMMQNSMVKNALQMLQNGDSRGLQEMAQNLCKEKGTDLDEVRTKIYNQFFNQSNR